MTINEALDKFGNLINNPSASLEDLNKIIDELSVEDNIASKVLFCKLNDASIFKLNGAVFL